MHNYDLDRQQRVIHSLLSILVNILGLGIIVIYSYHPNYDYSLQIYVQY